MTLLTVNRTIPRALLVSEIFENIMNHLKAEKRSYWEHQQPSYVQYSGPTLFALALTCRTLSEQALDALWHTLRGLQPLMRCASIIQARCKNFPEEDYPIILTEAQLAIIGRYANRVRCLRFRDGWPRPVQSFLQTLAYSSKVLMPNLRELGGYGKLVHLTCPLLGPRLQHLRIYVNAPEYGDCGEDLKFWQRISSRMILRSLHTTCPSLEKFEFEVDFSSQSVLLDAPLTLPISCAIQKMPKLRAVAVETITKDALVYLGGLSSFTSIKMRLPTGSVLEDIFNSSRNPVLFESCDSVSWKTREWRDVEVFIRLWPSKLTSMSLQSDVEFYPSLLEIFFKSLHMSSAFRNLQRIHLSDTSYDNPSSTTSSVITIDTIRPLLYLSRLRVVDIDTISCISMGEDDLEEIGDALPYLEVLLLNQEHGNMFGAALKPLRVSLSDVARFVERYPCLKKLCVCVTIRYVHHDYDMDEASLDSLEPRDSKSRLESLVLIYPCNEEGIWEHYQGEFDILFTKIFPQLKTDYIFLRSDSY
ncbi:hypothetical protein BDR04DRAFT_1145741 [Suillus decipiens]|nr:hypothetical protein BDR04DRAFT_1145741 [Suillus decipiens]